MVLKDSAFRPRSIADQAPGRLVINTPTASCRARRDGYMMRRLAVDMNIPFITTIQAARAAVRAIEESRGGGLDVKPLHAFHRSP